MAIGWVLAITAVMLLIYGALELYWLFDDVEDNTLSQIIIKWSSRTAFVPWFIGLVMGFLAGHWFG